MTDATPAVLRTHPCPVCDQPVPLGAESCPNPNCRVNLAELAAFDTLSRGLYQAALRQFEAGEPEGAIQTLQAALRYDPDHVDAWVVQGKFLAQQGNYAAACSCWQSAIDLCPGEPRALAGMQLARQKQAGACPAPAQKEFRWHAIVRVAVGLLVGLLVGYFLFYTSAAPESRSFDQTIHAYPALATLDLDVQEDSGNIKVSGILPDDTYRRWLEELARSSAHGKKVDTAGLQVAAAPDPSAAVKTALASDPRTQNLTVKVEPRAGGVAVAGSVPDEQALTALRMVAGGSGLAVDTSGLAVEVPRLVSAVQQRLAAEPTLTGEKILVSQEDTGIRLSGSVTTQPARDLAEQVAGQVPGVSWVDARDLKVRAVALVAEVKGALAVNTQMEGAEITVEQVGSAVKLSGKVARPEQLQIAGEIARSQSGVELVDLSGLEVAWQGQTYTVQAGDTLTGIAQKIYGQWWMWSVIVQANPEITDPRRVPPGQVLLLPRLIPAIDRGPYPRK